MKQWITNLSLPIACLLSGGCGGDDGETFGPGGSCALTVTGDEATSEQCNMFFCTGSDLDALMLTPPTGGPIRYQLAAELDAPARFTGGMTYTIEDFNDSTQLWMTFGAKTYRARTSGTRDPAETATLSVESIVPPGDVSCTGTFAGDYTVSLVEIIGFATPDEMVGPGRITATIRLDH